ncbi:glycosyltransferase [Cryomorpha ignava]|uniref:Glycosyltransferase n=1 Tax=Cryomorpha ignava TaxID=101383 RepID=A0A7K3WPF2_9FLAO|nr:glycosyltransferase [Cryomorpha ignava]NEN23416.1 glycosyltransferase [Cryomorpha ignava]
MNILFYFPSSQNSNSLETLMEEFSKMGHKVHLLSQEPKGDIQAVVEKSGVKTDSFVLPKSSSFVFYIKHIRYLTKYVKKNKIDLVYAHTQPANIIAVFAQYFSTARFIICRHHSDYIMNGTNRNAKIFDKIINRLGKEFIVPSKKVFHQLTEVEGVNPSKVRLINYAYRFENYPEPKIESLFAISRDFPCSLRLVTVSRFIPCKRYGLLISVIKALVDKQLDVKLLILGGGPLEPELKAQVKDLELERHVFFIGFTREAITYMAAADVVVHTSDSEASNSVIKEAGILEKLIIACADVGDFDDYIENGENGFLISKENTEQELTELLLKIYDDKSKYNHFGPALKKSVYKHFYVENVIDKYQEVK